MLVDPSHYNINNLCMKDAREHFTKSQITAYNVAQKLLKKRHFCSSDDHDLLAYTGTFYQVLSDANLKRMIIQLCRTDIEKAGGAKLIADTVEFLLYEPRIYRADRQNENKVSFLNGVLDADNGIFYSHSPLLFTTYLVNCNYNPDASQSPYFDAFLNQITGGDLSMQNRILEMIGYVLTPDTKGKVFFVLQGCPNSGKSVLSKLIKCFFNEDAVTAIDVHSLKERFAPGELAEKTLCISPDLPAGVLDSKSVSKLKQFTGNDIVSADRKYKSHKQFQCRARFILATNHFLITPEYDEGFYERIVAIPFQYSIPKEKRNPNLLDYLMQEKDAIANKAIIAYFNLKTNNYRFSGFYEINSAPYLQESETDTADLGTAIYSFVLSCFTVAPEDKKIFINEAYEVFIQTYRKISIEHFSKIFSAYTDQIFHAKNTGQKSRDNSTKKPLHYIAGITWKGGNL